MSTLGPYCRLRVAQWGLRLEGAVVPEKPAISIDGDRGGGEGADECPVQGQAAVAGPGGQCGRA